MVKLDQELAIIASNMELDKGFQALQQLMHDIAVSKGWWAPGKSFGEQIVMMHSELSEVIEEYRKTHLGVSTIYYENDDNGVAKPEGVPIELADCVIRILDTANRYNIDLFNAMLIKANYNLKRSHRHGDKKI